MSYYKSHITEDIINLKQKFQLIENIDSLRQKLNGLARINKSKIDSVAIEKTINLYQELVKNGKITGPEADSDYWVNNDSLEYKDFKDFVSKKLSPPTPDKSKGESIILLDSSRWLFVIPLNGEAASEYGRNTNWPFARNSNDFDRLFHDKKAALIFILSKETGKKWVIIFNRGESIYLDQDNVRLSNTGFEKDTGLEADEIFTYINPEDDDKIEQVRSEKSKN